jgi:NhaP-type Na+/H+ or K+/H+ antiporter
MDLYVLLLAVFGAVVLLTAWLPMVLKDWPLSLPIICIALGVLLVWSPLAPILGSNPLENRYVTERMTEFVVIVALMGAGLKLDRPLGWHSWLITWRLIGVAMPITIAAIALLGWGLLGLNLASALLLGAALAPTDPVLASDVQVGPPKSGEEDEVRFALTSEAGLNDGLSFPFVYLAIAVSLSQVTGESWLREWLLVDVVWKLAAGIGVGWLVGRLMGYLAFQLPKRAQLARTGDGFVALGITCLGYGLTELANGYGFVGVFVAALTLRSVERAHSYHESLHTFSEQIERLLMMVFLVFFGAAIAEGSVFSALNWSVVAIAALTLFVVRPVSAWIGLIGSAEPRIEKAVIAFFGIRGLGSIYYLAYATGLAKFERPEDLWATVFLVVLASIVVHGILVTPTMRYLDQYRGKSELHQ